MDSGQWTAGFQERGREQEHWAGRRGRRRRKGGGRRKEREDGKRRERKGNPWRSRSRDHWGLISVILAICSHMCLVPPRRSRPCRLWAPKRWGDDYFSTRFFLVLYKGPDALVLSVISRDSEAKFITLQVRGYIWHLLRRPLHFSLWNLPFLDHYPGSPSQERDF